MFFLVIIGAIIFACYQRRRWRAYMWDYPDELAGERGFCGAACGPNAWTRRGSSEAEGRASEKLARRAERFERKMRRRFDRQTGRWSGESADPEAGGEGRQFADEAQRRAYQRARRRAAAKAGFYIHLMWYGLVIGSLFLINLLTTGFQWWLFPAVFWGFGLLSHFAAVFGWRWIHERVFEPAIQREVEREVTREKEVLRTEKQASLDELTATFAHEIRNPIAAAKSLVQQMGEDPTSAENVEYAKVALDELARVERSVSHLLKYAKQEDYRFENVNLASVLDAALRQMRSKIAANSVVVSRNYLGGPTVRADADKLESVFSNIVDNAIDAMAATSGERKIELRIERDRPGMATVRIRDNGCGIPRERIGRIFNPFYTSKEDGTGLGLGVARKVVDAHRGTIEVVSEPEAGAEFAVSIPLARAGRGEGPDAPNDASAGADSARDDAGGELKGQP
jgi:signal transduction histidine kinase